MSIVEPTPAEQRALAGPEPEACPDCGGAGLKEDPDKSEDPYCQGCGGSGHLGEVLADPERHVCPECEQGKHVNCDGTAWDDAKDEPTSCTCNLHETTTTTGAGLI